jgi:hypothetical protein
LQLGKGNSPAHKETIQKKQKRGNKKELQKAKLLQLLENKSIN